MDLHNKVQGKFFDKDFRKKLRANPKQVLFDAKVKVVTNTKDTIYVVIPEQKVSAEVLGGVSAANIRNGIQSPHSHNLCAMGATGGSW